MKKLMKVCYALYGVTKLSFVLSLCFVFPLLPSVYAATFTVNGTADTVDASPGDGVCADGSGDCTLRAAILETNGLPGADIINVPAGSYILRIEGKNEEAAATGDLDVTDDLTINGAGAADTKIDADKIDRVLTIKGAINAEISGLTIMHGFFSFGGGGIRNEEGILTLINCIVTKNFSTDGSGIDNGGTLTLINSTVSNNGDIPTGEGGSGIYNKGTLILFNSTISNNGDEAPHYSIGGIANGSRTGATTNLIYSTISGNKGVGIGGVNFGSSDGTVNLIGSIIATNSNKDCEQNQFISLGYNIDSDGSCNLAQPHDLPNTDPLLGPLADNGGPTETHALLAGSPAIDAGEPVCTDPIPLTVDQRGEARPVDGHSDGIVACDIGAFELQPVLIKVPIDIKPGSDPNSINLCSNGAVPIAILGSNTFDVYDIDTETLRFSEASVNVVGKKDPHSLCSYEDVNDDIFYDLVCHFLTADIAGIDGQSSTATVNGELLNGTLIEGTDSINIVKDKCN